VQRIGQIKLNGNERKKTMLKLELSKEQVEAVLQALAQQPYRSVVSLIEAIVKQAQAQTQTQQEEK
jgi:hypothetical protein